MNTPYLAASRPVCTALDGNAAVVEVNGATFIFAYLSPSYKPDSCIQDLLELADSLVDAGANKCIIAGDLNARSERLTSDHNTNDRGRKLEAALEGSAFQVQQPTNGKWTSFNGGGHGIPDLVLANFCIRDLEVHERETCGGSDHHPLTFSVPDQPPKAKLVERWNIRRLTKPATEAKYQKALEEELAGVPLEAKCRELAQKVQEDGLGGDELQAKVDDMWAALIGCIQRAADQSVGHLKYQSRTPRDFWTQGLEEERDQVVAMQMAAQEAQLEGTESQMQIWLRYRKATNRSNSTESA